LSSFQQQAAEILASRLLTCRIVSWTSCTRFFLTTGDEWWTITDQSSYSQRLRTLFLL